MKEAQEEQADEVGPDDVPALAHPPHGAVVGRQSLPAAHLVVVVSEGLHAEARGGDRADEALVRVRVRG